MIKSKNKGKIIYIQNEPQIHDGLSLKLISLAQLLVKEIENFQTAFERDKKVSY